MKISSLLSIYIIKSFIKNFIIVILGFIVIISLIESMDIVRRVSLCGCELLLVPVIKLSILKSIVTVSSFFPFTVLLGVAVFFIRMHNKLELTSIKLSGVSIRDLLKTLLFTASLISVFYITIYDTVSVYSVNKINSINTVLNNENLKKNQITIRNGIWFRSMIDHSAYIIYAQSVDDVNSHISNVQVFKFNKNDELLSTTFADSVIIGNGKWKLNNVITTNEKGDKNKIRSQDIPIKLTIKGINRMLKDPNCVSFWRIHKCIYALKKVGLSSIKYKVSFYKRLSSILQMLTLVILATICCTSNNLRNSKFLSIKIILLIVISFPLYFFNSILFASSETGLIPTELVTFIIPIVIFLMCWIVSRNKICNN